MVGRQGGRVRMDDLQARVDILNAFKAEVFMSIHANSAAKPREPGKVQVFYCAGSDCAFPAEGRRLSTLGALLIGYYEDGVFRYAGRVGTGFKERDLQMLMNELKKRVRADSPFVPPPVGVICSFRVVVWPSAS